MRHRAIQQGYPQIYSLTAQPTLDTLRNISRACCDFEKREGRSVELVRYAPDKLGGCGDPPKPQVDSLQVSERGRDFFGRARIAIEQFCCDHTLHGWAVFGRRPSVGTTITDSR